jgi:hypothetical protein
MRLNSVYERSSAPYGGSHMHGLGDMLKAHAFFKTGCGVRVDAVWALHRMRHGNADEGLLPLSQHARLQCRGMLVNKLLEQRRIVLAYFAEPVEIFRFVVLCHATFLPF